MSTVGDCVIPVAASSVCNDLPCHVRLAYSAVPFPIFCSAREVSYVVFEHFNRFCYLLAVSTSVSDGDGMLLQGN